VQPIPFGGPAGPLRLFGVGLGDQGAWILPLSLVGLLGLALLVLADRMPGQPPGERELASWRSDPRLATALVLGGWLVVEAVVLSLSKGIVHPYYVSALAPGAAAMAGAGAVAFVELTRGPRLPWGLALASCGVGATVLVQIVLLHREHYMLWFVPVLLAGAAAGVGVMVAARRLAAPAMAFVFLLLLVAPTAYSTTTWRAPVEGTFPAAGPKQATGAGGFGVNSKDLKVYRALMTYVRSHHPGTRWALLTVASNTAAPFILMGLDAGALGGYSGTDPALDGRGLARLLASGKARYVMLGGEFSTRGGNRATRAVLSACRQLPDETWNTAGGSSLGFVLFDCAGDERALSTA
jgi:4-amino-4-deoxy-L-arabinose transferase-like glycosyltransferase